MKEEKHTDAALAIMGALFSPFAQAEAKTINVELTAVETEVVIEPCFR